MRVFENMEDSYLRTRCDDLDHVVSRILAILLEQHATPLGELRGQIVLAEDLAPADVIMMKNQGIAGFVTESGGPMSHTAILARSLGIPAVVAALQHADWRVRRGGTDATGSARYKNNRSIRHDGDPFIIQ
mgnify:CR=1 FL=1